MPPQLPPGVTDFFSRVFRVCGLPPLCEDPRSDDQQQQFVMPSNPSRREFPGIKSDTQTTQRSVVSTPASDSANYAKNARELYQAEQQPDFPLDKSGHESIEQSPTSPTSAIQQRQSPVLNLSRKACSSSDDDFFTSPVHDASATYLFAPNEPGEPPASVPEEASPRDIPSPMVQKTLSRKLSAVNAAVPCFPPACDLDKLENSLSQVLEKCRTEYLIAAHEIYMGLIRNLDGCLSSFRVYGLFRPAGWLKERRTKASSLDQFIFDECTFPETTHSLSRRISMRLQRIGTMDKTAQAVSSQNSKTLGVLAEKFSVAPLTSQRERDGPSWGPDGMAFAVARKGAGVDDIFEEDLATAETAAERALLGRIPLAQRVWALGELPATIFATHGESLDVATDDERIKGLKMGYDYGTRMAGGLCIPVDVQVAFVLPASYLRGGREQDLVKWARLHGLLEAIVNNAQIQKLRLQIYQTRRAELLLRTPYDKDQTCQRASWVEQSVIWKMFSTGDAFSLITGTLEAPILESLALVNESAEYKRWIPFLGEGQKVHQVSTFAQIIRLRHSLTWPLDDRETVLFGYAVDLLHKNPQPSVLMNAVSVPDGATSIFGLPVSPPQPGLTRLHLKFLTFELLPNPENSHKTEVNFLTVLNPQIDVVPKTVQGLIAKRSTTRMFSSIKKLTHNFAGSVYEKKLVENGYVYDSIRERLNKFYGKNWKEPS